MSNDGRSTADGALPDVGRDESAIAAYEQAKLRYIRGITADAEEKLRDALANRREAISGEITSLRLLHRIRADAASAAVQRYLRLLPHRARKAGLRPPSLGERILTLDAAQRRYIDARKASDELEETNELLRKLRDRLDTMERETRRSITMREEAVRKKLQTPEGLAALHGDATVKAAFATMQGAMNARAKYEERVKKGDVPPEDARDREMAQRGMRFAAVPLSGVMIARIVRYGPLEYYVLRDLENREHLLSLDPALEPLRDAVFSVARAGDGCEASLYRPAGDLPMSILEHLKASYSTDDAANRYARHRAALRTDRATHVTMPRDDAEAALIAALALLARAVVKQPQTAGTT